MCSMPYRNKLKLKRLHPEKSNYITRLHNLFIGRSV
jgi:hypothetical protein